jgi:hypothetical protein
MEKSALACDGGACPFPFSLLPSPTKLQCTLLLFHLYPFVLCDSISKLEYSWVEYKPHIHCTVVHLTLLRRDLLTPSVLSLPVLRIHDILVWIRTRIWICGSMPLTYGSGFGSGSCYFRHWLTRSRQKTNFKKKFFCLLLFEGTFASFFKDKKSKISLKAVGIKVFLPIYAWWYKASDPDLYLWLMNPDPDPGGPKTNGLTDPGPDLDQDPQHCSLHCL